MHIKNLSTKAEKFVEKSIFRLFDTHTLLANFERFSSRCGNVAAILELDENLQREFTIFEAAPQESRGIPCKKPQADYFL